MGDLLVHAVGVAVLDTLRCTRHVNYITTNRLRTTRPVYLYLSEPREYGLA
jgi:hypothetical protein